MSESGERSTGDERREVWLRANSRPVAAASAVIVAAVSAVAVAAGLLAGPTLGLGIVAAVGVIVAGLGCLAAAALQPRLVRRGGHLEVRLSPQRVERVPLEAVECLFRGSEPVSAAAADAAPRFRVGTLVVRLAERAERWRSRPTFRPWGVWEDGYITIDGRWCEPLSRETIGRIAEQLIAAKRDLPQPGGDRP